MRRCSFWTAPQVFLQAFTCNSTVLLVEGTNVLEDAPAHLSMVSMLHGQHWALLLVCFQISLRN